MALNTTGQETTNMENKKSKEKPKGRTKISASGGMFYWGVDRDGVMWQK